MRKRSQQQQQSNGAGRQRQRSGGRLATLARGALRVVSVVAVARWLIDRRRA